MDTYNTGVTIKSRPPYYTNLKLFVLSPSIYWSLKKITNLEPEEADNISLLKEHFIHQ
jgi:hypothetical protein